MILPKKVHFYERPYWSNVMAMSVPSFHSTLNLISMPMSWDWCWRWWWWWGSRSDIIVAGGAAMARRMTSDWLEKVRTYTDCLSQDHRPPGAWPGTNTSTSNQFGVEAPPHLHTPQLKLEIRQSKTKQLQDKTRQGKAVPVTVTVGASGACRLSTDSCVAGQVETPSPHHVSMDSNQKKVEENENIFRFIRNKPWVVALLAKTI